jgi:hypothetical protein
LIRIDILHLVSGEDSMEEQYGWKKVLKVDPTDLLLQEAVSWLSPRVKKSREKGKGFPHPYCDIPESQ